MISRVDRLDDRVVIFVDDFSMRHLKYFFADMGISYALPWRQNKDYVSIGIKDAYRIWRIYTSSFQDTENSELSSLCLCLRDIDLRH